MSIPFRDTCTEKTRGVRALFLIGTRAQLIRTAPVLWAAPPSLECLVCFTGEQTTSLDELAPLLAVRPSSRALRLEGPHGERDATQLGRLILELDRVLRDTSPDVVVAHGEARSVVAGALAALSSHIPFAHIGAGDRSDSFAPRDTYRRAVTAATAAHFAPTARAATNLRREGVPHTRIYQVGNTIVDAARRIARHLPSPAQRVKRVVVFTAHRREDEHAPPEHVVVAIEEIAGRRPDVEIVWPLQDTRSLREAARRLSQLPNVRCIAPLRYPAMIDLLRAASVVLTDSNSVQQEASSLGVPSLVLHAMPACMDGVDEGAARTVGTDPARIICRTLQVLEDPRAHALVEPEQNPYGDGRAGLRIATLLAAGVASAADARGAITPSRGTCEAWNVDDEAAAFVGAPRRPAPLVIGR